MKPSRKQQILEVLATELETKPGSRITTASLAAAVGVSEAALYRHFPSKAKMFDALIDFADESVSALANRIITETTEADLRCSRICSVVLRFAERNPGIARVLMGDILVGEHERLRTRVAQFFERLETQLRQVLRDALLAPGAQPDRALVNASANLLSSVVAGRIAQFVRTAYRQPPSAQWEEQWTMLARGIFVSRGGPGPN